MIVEVVGTDLPEQVKQFVKDLNMLKDEGFIDYTRGENGIVRVIPAEGIHSSS